MKPDDIISQLNLKLKEGKKQQGTDIFKQQKCAQDKYPKRWT